MTEETTQNVTRIGRNNISIDALDEISNCISDCITLANLMEARDVRYPIPEGTTAYAGRMIGEKLRQVQQLQRGRAS